MSAAEVARLDLSLSQKFPDAHPTTFQAYGYDGLPINPEYKPPISERVIQILVVREGVFFQHNVEPQRVAHVPGVPYAPPRRPKIYNGDDAAKAAGRPDIRPPPSSPPDPADVAGSPAPTVATEPKAENPADIERLFHAIRHRWGYK